MIRALKPSQSKKQKKSDPQIPYVPLKYTLMGSFLLLIIPILIALSVFDYLNAKSDLESAYNVLQNQTENNIVNAIKLVDAGHKVLTRFVDQQMKDAFVTFIDAYEVAKKEPSKMDLEDIKKQLEDKMDLYIINSDNVVEYTTYTKDLGLDFKKWSEYVELFNKIRKQREFFSGGLSTEDRTGTIRTFAYMPTPDGKYLLELGLRSNEFSDLLGELDLVKITARLQKLNPSLNQVRIFSRHGDYSLGSIQKTDEATKKIVRMVYESRKSFMKEDTQRKLYIKYLFVNLKDDDIGPEAADPSKVIEVTYNTTLIDEGLQRTASFHFVLSVVAIVLSIIFTFIISGWITRPIQSLVDSVNIIARGNLQHPITVKTNNELKLLKQSITIMVDNMIVYINKIEQQNEDLKELDKLKDDFLSNTSHELRTPLNGIIGIADSMIDGAAGSLSQKAIANLSMIVLSGRRLSNLVNDILDFSKLKHKNIELQSKPVEMRVVTEVVLTLSAPLIASKRIELVNNIKDDTIVEADENRVQQILHNLVSNAIKFTESGTIEVSSVEHSDYITIEVSDSGIGIPSNKIQKVFTPFEQADGSISRQYGGTGLGLSITKQLVELHGGEIHIESKVGIGTKVSFTLPLSKQPIGEYSSNVDALLDKVRNLQPIEVPIEEDNDLEPLLETSIQGRESFNVLIVDDDPINLQVIENHLSLESYTVTRAVNGQEALEAVNGGTSFVIILLDIMMPKMSGFEVCKIIREKHPATQLPIIMLTAKNQVSDLVEGLQSGANDYLTKPFSLGELGVRVGAILKRQRAVTQAVQQRLMFDQLIIDPVRREVTLNNQSVSLTALEFDLLHFLASHPGRVWRRSELIQAVWDYEYVGDQRVVDVHIGQIRKKIETNADQPALIQTIRGVGYKFELPGAKPDNGK